MDNSNSDDIVSLPEDSLTEDVKTSKDKQRSAEKIRHHEQKVRICEPEDNLVRESKPANSNYLEPWVQFEDNTRDGTSSSGIKFWNNVFVASKILMCVLIFMLILSAAVVSKICFIIITANIYPTYDKGPIDNLKTMNGIIKYYTKETNVLWIWALILMAGTPYVFTAVKCLWRVTFVGTKLGGKGRLGRLPCTAIIVRLLFETINSVGLNMMIFIVIPKLDPVSGLLMTNCIGLVPALLKVFYPTDKPKVQTSSSGKWSERSAAVLIISILGVSGQIAAIGLWVYHVYNTLNGAIYSSTYIISLILAPIFTSAHWWENFVYESKRKQGLTQANRDKTTKTRLSNEMNQVETRKETITLSGLPRIMRKYRYQLSLYASIWRIILTFVMPTAVYGLYCQHHHASCVDIVFFKTDTAALNSSIGHIEFVTSYAFGSCSDYLPIIIAAVGALSSGICYKLGKIACKIMTQVVDFSLPLVLSTPATLGLVFGMYSGFISTTDKGCAIPFPTLTNSQENYFLSWYMDSKNHWLPISAGLCGFISLLLVTNYIWTPGKERLQTTEKLFVLPLYCGIFIDQSLMLNRRRIEQSYKQKKKARKIAVANKVEDGNNSGRTSEAEIPMIYLCATMWHENEQEMTQLLKSILRFDMYQYDHYIAKHVFERDVPNFFKFEAHIFFDDAFEPHSNVKNDFKVNKHVMLLIGTVSKSASEMYGNNYKIPDPKMISTRYGGRLVWKLPGMNMLTAHLKNNQLIRHRKRWSQVNKTQTIGDEYGGM